ncbi:MAG: sigma-70 family RNA polymerase sigma factor [Myxococcaceae bacterium]|nr:sigma-70 family RNA polymerase sigma factor [Myxococcaceae bacterium]
MASRLLSFSALVPNVLRRATRPCAGAADASLVSRVRAEDPTAFREMFDRHAPAVWRFLGDLVDDSFADEGLQECFVRAFAGMGQLREDTRLQSWLYGIARNVALEHLRARRRDRPAGARELSLDSDDAQALFPPTDEALSPETLLLGRETEALMTKALARLSDDRRAALLMRVDGGLSYEEIAQAMSWTIPKVKNEIHRARMQLRADLLAMHGGGS